ELIQLGGRLGIHRVARSVLTKLLTNPPVGYRVEPVYATKDKLGYYYARRFTLQFLDCPIELLRDEPAELQQGDMFLGLDLQHHVALSQSSVLADMRTRGIKAYFIVYDLLPILMPQCFPEADATQHASWISMLSKHADGVACISRSVANELVKWLN